MRRTFKIIDTYGYEVERVTVEVPATTSLADAQAEAIKQFSADQRSAYDANEQYKADSVIASIARAEVILPARA